MGLRNLFSNILLGWIIIKRSKPRMIEDIFHINTQLRVFY